MEEINLVILVKYEYEFREKLLGGFSSGVSDYQEYDAMNKKHEVLLSKLYSKCPEEHFEEFNIFEKFIISYHFRILGEKLSAFCRKLHKSVVKNAVYLSRGKF